MKTVSKMTSTVIAKMKTCEKEAKVTVKMRDDGDLDVIIESDCDIVQAYGERLKTISQMDVYNFQESKINADDIRVNLTPTCIVPNAIYNAAFLEMGLLTKTLAKKSKENSIEFVIPDTTN